MRNVMLAYLLSFSGAVGGVFKPWYGVLAYVALANIKPESLTSGLSGDLGGYSRMVGMCLLLGWAMQGLGKWNFGRANWIVWCLVVYWLSAINAMEFAINPQISSWHVQEIGKILLIFMIGITNIDSVAKLKQLAWVIIISQGYVAWHLHEEYYFKGVNVAHLYGYGPLDNVCLGVAMDATAGLAFFLGLHDKGWRRVVALVMAALMASTVMLTHSRGAVLGLIATGVATFIMIPKRPIYLLLLVIALAVALRLAGSGVRDRFATTFEEQENRDMSAQSRLDLWRDAGIQMFRRPLTGVGPFNWGLVAPEYGWAKGKEVHSTWMQTGAEQGIPGFVALIAFYLLCIGKLWKLTRNSYPLIDPWLRVCAAGVITGLVGFAVSAQFVTMYGLEVAYYLVLLGAGIIKVQSLAEEAALVARWRAQSARQLRPTARPIPA